MSECIEYEGARTTKGYGQYTLPVGRGKYIMLAHRVAYELAHGPIPAGLQVMHTCDNPPCVNPEHLRVGTGSDNMRDCVEKGRHREASKTHCDNGHEFTEENVYRRPDRPEERACRACARERMRGYRKRKKEARA